MDPDLRTALEEINAGNVRLDSTRWAFVLEDLQETPAADAAVGLGYADIVWDEGDDVYRPVRINAAGTAALAQ